MHVAVAVIVLLAGSAELVKAVNKFNCEPSSGDGAEFPRAACYLESCMAAIKNHIKEELNAAFSYMYMASRFDEDKISRPGLAKFLYEAASEERGHAKLMLEYLNMRGMTYDSNFSLDIDTVPLLQELMNSEIADYKSALKTALNMEIDVTNKIYNVIEQCVDDFHGADKFTEPILAEQHEGVRQLQGAIRAFDDLAKGHADNPSELALAEYLFDRKLLAGEI